MSIEEIKAAINGLTVEERRKVALYILELEKEHVKKTVGPQITKDLDDLSATVHDAVEKLKKFIIKG